MHNKDSLPDGVGRRLLAVATKATEATKGESGGKERMANSRSPPELAIAAPRERFNRHQEP
jgi:hypothetical protein